MFKVKLKKVQFHLKQENYNCWRRKTVEIDPSTYTLLGEDGQPATEVPAKDPEGNVIGKYTLKTVDGKAVAVFEPTDKTYSGDVQPVRVQAKDKNGTAVETTYTPKITR